jgi:FHS family Na+ dependent glucose MFS transporter 1
MAGHPLMGMMLLVVVVMLILVPLIPLLLLLTLTLLVLGMAEGMVDVGGNTLLVWVHRHRVGPFMNGLHFFFGVGAFLSPIIIAQAVLLSDDITWAYWVLALLVLPVALWLLRLPSPANQVTATANAPVHINSVLVMLIAFFFFLYVGAEISFGGWIFTYAVALNLANETSAAYLTSAFWGALTAGRLLAIPLAARFRPRVILLSDLLGCLLSVGIILLWSNSLVAVWIGTLGLGLSMASVFPTTLSLAERRITITGQVTGRFFVGASAGGMTIPWLIGQFFEAVGPTVTMLIIFITLLAALATFAVLIGYSAQLRLVPEQES